MRPVVLGTLVEETPWMLQAKPAGSSMFGETHQHLMSENWVEVRPVVLGTFGTSLVETLRMLHAKMTDSSNFLANQRHLSIGDWVGVSPAVLERWRDVVAEQAPHLPAEEAE